MCEHTTYPMYSHHHLLSCNWLIAKKVMLISVKNGQLHQYRFFCVQKGLIQTAEQQSIPLSQMNAFLSEHCWAFHFSFRFSSTQLSGLRLFGSPTAQSVTAVENGPVCKPTHSNDSSCPTAPIQSLPKISKTKTHQPWKLQISFLSPWYFHL